MIGQDKRLMRPASSTSAHLKSQVDRSLTLLKVYYSQNSNFESEREGGAGKQRRRRTIGRRKSLAKQKQNNFIEEHSKGRRIYVRAPNFGTTKGPRERLGSMRGSDGASGNKYQLHNESSSTEREGGRDEYEQMDEVMEAKLKEKAEAEVDEKKEIEIII